MPKIYLKRELKKDKKIYKSKSIDHIQSKDSYSDLGTYMYRKTFVPEIKPELIPFEESYWKKVFGFETILGGLILITGKIWINKLRN